MTANEFKELFNKFINPGEMTIGEYRKLSNEVSSEVKKAMSVVFKKFSILVREIYDIDYYFSPDEFLYVDAGNSKPDEVCIVCGDKYDSGTSRCTKIDLDVIAHWVEGDFSVLIDKSYARIKSSLESDIVRIVKNINTLKEEVDCAQKILDDIKMNESETTAIDKTSTLEKYLDYVDTYAI